MNTQPNNLNTPWSLHFDRDGTEDIAIICDGNGEELVRSRHFWLPEGDDPMPLTLAAMLLMVAAPKLLQQLVLLTDHLETRPHDLSEGIRALRLREAHAAIAKATSA